MHALLSDQASTGGAVGQGAWYDVVVFGGGAAGLSGALALARSRRSVLVIDGGEPRNAPAAHIHTYLSCIGEGSERSGFRVTLADRGSVSARRLLIATGLVDELPTIPGVRKRWGRDVLHCAYCHGWEVRNQAIGILGTGPMTVHQALLFRQLSADVLVFQHTAPALPKEQAEQLAARGIRIVTDEVAALEVHDDCLAGVRLRSGEVIPRQAVVVTPRFVARADLLRTFGLEPTRLEIGVHVVATSIAADANGATSVPGIWVAGNVTDPSAQVITAAAAGLKVGAQINADLVAECVNRAETVFLGDQGASTQSGVRRTSPCPG